MTYNTDELNQLKDLWKAVESEPVELQFPIPDEPQFPLGAVPIPISSTARHKAAHMAGLCDNVDRRETMRRNLLATIAVHNYLSLQGYLPDLGASDSWNPILGRTGEVADLVVSQVGRFECCAIKPGQLSCSVLAEGQFGRSGYVMVEMDALERWGWLLGFIPGGDEVEAIETLNREELQSMDEFGHHLHRLFEDVRLAELPLSQLGSPEKSSEYLDQTRYKVWANLRQWFDQTFEGGWQAIDALLESNHLALATRTRDLIQSQMDFPDESGSKARAWKVIELEQLDHKIPIVLVLAITPQPENEGIDIRIKAYPGDGSIFLPADLQLSIHDHSDTEVCSAQARNAEIKDNLLQLGFVGQDFSITESFNI
jgi:Protein of unknown function (DUF1822)